MESKCLQFDVPIINKSNLNKVLETLTKKDSSVHKDTQQRFKSLIQSFITHLKTLKDAALKNAEVTMVDNCHTTVTVLSGGGQNKFYVSMNHKAEVEILSAAPPPEKGNMERNVARHKEPIPERLKENIESDDSRTEYISELITLPVINKTKLGKVLVNICGNEGSKDTPVQAVFRKLLQTTIDYLKKEKEAVWTNAEVTHYDIYGNTVVVTAGKAQHKFVVQINGKDEIEIAATKRPGLFSPVKSFFKEEYKRSMPKRAIAGSDGTPPNGQWTVSKH